ncbi:hypothetical protein [Vibrio cholerae]|uniref:hypothetical protein n=1 Tax=Vibrio cholerae TaxID=666 RepID=UPI0006E526AD|nr:hypothetical protein [Vibrio cholerae]ELE1938592.1 hypothetical protein [Vibrio cholerae]KQA52611.1 hypothetical protein XV78_12795 [Vibrio cholerae]KQA62070.1 hypothetical protein XV81_13675 [Vibrio cholerae]KQA97180.1 hypothetical protein XV90_01100 [Vibrio cholerae]
MKVVPMIFNTEMVKALMAGDKVVTRRPVSPQPEISDYGYDWWPSKKFGSMVQVSGFEKIDCDYKRDLVEEMARDACPIANIGDLIYVRETFRLFNHSDECGCSDYCSCPPSGTPVYFATCGGDSESKWKPSIHMPRAASRLTLKVTDVRIERVQDITEEQAIKEGMPTDEECQRMAIESGLGWYQKPDIWFKNLWDSIYGNWHQNPYVWVIEFEVIHQNVDQYLQSIKNAA